jgi:hypothetical protein
MYKLFLCNKVVLPFMKIPWGAAMFCRKPATLLSSLKDIPSYRQISIEYKSNFHPVAFAVIGQMVNHYAC